MSVIIDTLVTMGVVAVFFWFMYMRFVSKFPAAAGKVGDYFPFLKPKEKELKPQMEVSRQKWTDHREIL